MLKINVFLFILMIKSMKIVGQINLYQTDRMKNENRLEFDCLIYVKKDEQLTYQHLSNIIEDSIKYCIRPIDEMNSLWNENENEIRVEMNQSFTFEHLFLNNITIEELLSWSATIDLIEDYQIYVTTMNRTMSKRIFNNCSQSWFGNSCQYSFVFSNEMNLDKIVFNEFHRKDLIESNESAIPCYIHLKCDRGYSTICLDWREICDGFIDCLNDGIDEYYCYEMELNECEIDEYRCHNGQCIPKEFWNDDRNDPDCLDRSDETINLSYLNNCYKNPSFRCEEHSCRHHWHQFSCGDGQCVQKFDQCQNGRDKQLKQSMIFRNNSMNSCLNLMICLTLFNQYLEDNLSCQQWFKLINPLKYLEDCPLIIEFPSLPIHFGHIRLLYKRESIERSININKYPFPDYICFNKDLCHCLIANYFYENLTCLTNDQFEFNQTISGYPWIDLILIIHNYFSSCLLPYPYEKIQNQEKKNFSFTIYFCRNSSKWISKHRIMDETQDCCYGDDENSTLSCLLNDPYRISCQKSNICLSSLHRQDDCPDDIDKETNEILFQQFCNGLVEYSFQDENGLTFNDESECLYWPCKNLYSQCDGYWNCLNGEDETNCYSMTCPSMTHSCLSPINLTLICLSSTRVNDGIIDCLGSSDELNYCRSLYPMKRDYERFHCSNSDLCLSIKELCNQIQTCPQGDDELFCDNFHFICQNNFDLNRTTTKERILCELSEYKKGNFIYFSLNTSFEYPIDEENQNEKQIFHLNQTEFIDLNENQKKIIENKTSIDICYRGLTINYRSNKNQIHIQCLCPPSYYGNYCQYQNQRISLTIEIIQGYFNDIYTILVLLIDNENQLIESFDQFDLIPSQSCSIKFNRYLLYSERPKNISKTYSIFIEIYDKKQFVYYGTWKIEVPFVFLPVNRMSTLLILSHTLKKFPNDFCPLKCHHGQCVKYENRNEYFCHCQSGWSGTQCNQKLNCQMCSTDSICYGINNISNPICICPFLKFGRKCLLKLNCPINACLNRGLCIPTKYSNENQQTYSCLCNQEFYGSNCQFLKRKIHIDLNQIQWSSYLKAFFLTVSDDSSPKWTIIIEKLTLFQRQLTFYLSIPFNLILIQSNNQSYLVLVRKQPISDLTTSINSKQICFPMEHLFNSTIMNFHRYRRLKYVHLLCQKNIYSNCFYDENYFCLCTIERQANCLNIDQKTIIYCKKNLCLNNGECLQDHRHCSSSIICICSACFFGDRCQFYAKDFGLTLDEILGYEIQRNQSLFDQPFSVQLSLILTIFIFLIGLFNGICSIITFRQRICHEIGCGQYLFASSITSLLIIIFFTGKFFLLVFSSKDVHENQEILYLNCMIVEPILKILFNLNNWFQACVAIERVLTVSLGIYFQKNKSKRVAKWMIFILILIHVGLFIPHIHSLHLYYDKKERRTWCVVYYSKQLQYYHNLILILQFFIPFLLNVFSALFIISSTTRKRMRKQSTNNYFQDLKKRFFKYKHLLISPIVLVLLSLPRLIISFTLNCQKASNYFWFHLLGYFISFVPSAFIFIVFVLPSPIFKKAFQQAFIQNKNSLTIKRMKYF